MSGAEREHDTSAVQDRTAGPTAPAGTARCRWSRHGARRLSRRRELRVHRPVRLPATARARLGFEKRIRTPLRTETSGRIGDADVEVTVESHVSAYDATNSELTAGVVSTPAASVGDRQFNPLATLEPARLLTDTAGLRVLERIGLDSVGHARETVAWARTPERIGTRRVTCLDAPATLESYGGVLAGEPPSVAVVHIARVERASVVIGVATHGRDVSTVTGTLVGNGGHLARETVERVAERVGRITDAFRYA